MERGRAPAPREALKEDLGKALSEFRSAAREEAASVRRELAEAVTRADEAGAALAASVAETERMRSTLVDYLRERDMELERARDGLLADLVEDFAEGLGKREAQRAGEKLGAARERSRDRRDARRYRDQHGQTDRD